MNPYEAYTNLIAEAMPLHGADDPFELKFLVNEYRNGFMKYLHLDRFLQEHCFEYRPFLYEELLAEMPEKQHPLDYFLEHQERVYELAALKETTLDEYCQRFPLAPDPVAFYLL